MRRPIRPALLLAALGLLTAQVLTVTPAGAQSRPFCPEGRTAEGRCVNPKLAVLARQQAVCFTQIKLSYVVCPGVLPGLDTRYQYPHTVVTERQRELNIIFER